VCLQQEHRRGAQGEGRTGGGGSGAGTGRRRERRAVEGSAGTGLLSRRPPRAHPGYPVLKNPRKTGGSHSCVGERGRGRGAPFTGSAGQEAVILAEAREARVAGSRVWAHLEH